MKISAIIISRNEEENIEECIKGLSFVEEIIVVDNNSKDRTVSIAKKLGAKVYIVPGLDFSYLRNIGKEKAKGEWLLYIDADEKVTESLSSEIMAVLKNKNDFVAYSVPRQNYYFNTPWPKIEKIIRLIKKDALIGWQGKLHETPIVAGKAGNFSFPLLHYTHRTITSMIIKTNEWSDIEAFLRYRNNHPKISWWRFFRVMLTAFWKSFIAEEGWKAGTIGLMESTYQAFSIFITYAKLWEMQNQSRVTKKKNEKI